MRTNPGVIALSTAPSKNLFTAMPAKLVHAGVVMTITPQAKDCQYNLVYAAAMSKAYQELYSSAFYQWGIVASGIQRDIAR